MIQDKNRLNQYFLSSSSVPATKNLDDSMGTRVTATTNDAINENETVNAKGVNKSDAMPSTNTMGKNTTNVVVVDAMTAGANSLAPLIALSISEWPFCRYVYICSKITIELSTIIPTPNARPPRVRIFNVSPVKYIKVNVEIMAIGIDTPITIVALTLFRNKSKTMSEMAPPIKMFFTTESMDI